MIEIIRPMPANALRHMETFPVQLFVGEVNAHKIIVTPLRSGLFLGHNVTARFVNAAGQDVVPETYLSIEGNACVILTASCYAAAGVWKLYVYITDENETVCVYACTGNCVQTVTQNSAGEPATPIVENYSDEQLDDLTDGVTANAAAIEAHNAQLTELNGDVNTLKTTVSGLSNVFQYIQEDITDLNTDVDGLKSTLAEPLEKLAQVPYEKYTATGNTVTMTGLNSIRNVPRLRVTLEPTADGNGGFITTSGAALVSDTSSAPLVPSSYTPPIKFFETDSGNYVQMPLGAIAGFTADYVADEFVPSWFVVTQYTGDYDFPARWVSSAGESGSAGQRPTAGTAVAFEETNMGTYAGLGMSHLTFGSSPQLRVAKSRKDATLAGYQIDAAWWTDPYQQQLTELAADSPDIERLRTEYYNTHFWGSDKVSQMSASFGGLRVTRLANIITLNGTLTQAEASSGVLRIAISERLGECGERGPGSAVIDPVLELDSTGKYLIAFEVISGSITSNATVTLYYIHKTSGTGGYQIICAAGNSKVITPSGAKGFLALAVDIGSEESVAFNNWQVTVTVTRVDALAAFLTGGN